MLTKCLCCENYKLFCLGRAKKYLWTPDVGNLLLLLIAATSKGCTHARRNHNRKNTHSTTRCVSLCGESVGPQQWFLTWGKFTTGGKFHLQTG